MAKRERCPNPSCGRVSAFGDDRLGRTFRCPSCRIKLTGTGPGAGPGFALPLTRPVPGGVLGDAPRPTGRWDGGTAPEDDSRRGGASPHVGRFRIIETLGSGAFATVYRAFDPKLRREVALKVLHAGVIEGSQAVARFLAEARAMARLDHPQIVTIHDAGHDEGRHYIASTFIEGRNLARTLDDGPLDPRAAARTAADLAEALAYAHDRGVVHRDVTPGNILIDARGTVHLSDFGLAHCHDSSERLTLDGAILGTPAYVAPEQAQGGAGPLPASDQYGLGVVLYELLCGRPPFTGPPLLVLFQAVHREPPPPRSVRPGVPRELEAICLRALSKRPEDRYPNCRDLATDLKRWLEGGPIRRHRHGERARSIWRDLRRLGPAVATALVALSLLAAMMLVSVRSVVSHQASNVDPQDDPPGSGVVGPLGQARLGAVPARK